MLAAGWSLIGGNGRYLLIPHRDWQNRDWQNRSRNRNRPGLMIDWDAAKKAALSGVFY